MSNIERPIPTAKSNQIVRSAMVAMELAPVRRRDVVIPVKDIKSVHRNSSTGTITTESLLTQIKRLETENERLKAMLLTDQMTRLGNETRYMQESRKIISKYLRDRRSNANATQNQISFVVIDGNGLKALNDNIGHEAGDHAIKRLAKAIEKTTRESDYPYRRGKGADEFVVILNGTDKQGAVNFIDRLRGTLNSLNKRSYENTDFKFDVSFSAGVSNINEIEKTYLAQSMQPIDQIRDRLFKLAEKRMYENKAAMKGSR